MVAGMTGDQASFTCPVCGTPSPHPDDAANGYCVACHMFTGELAVLPADARTWTTVDKTEWPAGPWHAEPDRVQWTDPLSDLPCLITRHPEYGCLVGYVAVPPGDPLHGAAAGQVPALAPGSITFTGASIGTLNPAGIPPCDLDNPWWIGFGAFHAWDVSPGETVMWDLLGVTDGGIIPGPDGPIAEYRPIAYMTAGCRLLAMQLAGLLVFAQPSGGE